MDNINLTYDGIRKDFVTVLQIKKPYWATRTRNILTTPGRPGGHLTSTDVSPLIIPVRIEVEGVSSEDYERKAEEVAGWFNIAYPAPLIFDRYPNRTYYAVVEGDLDPDEIVSVGYVDVSFVCPDPYGYGPEQTADLGSAIQVNSKALTDPLFTLTLKEPTTFLAVGNGDKMNLVGNPLAEGDTPKERYTRRYWSEANSLIGWAIPGAVEGGAVTGTMATDGFRFYASNYGTGSLWHGPARKISLPEILTDFRVDALVEFDNSNASSWGRISVSGLDQANNVVFSMSMADAYATPRALGQIRAGSQSVGHNVISHIGSPPAWNNFEGFLRVTRYKNTWTAYITRYNMITGHYEAGMYETWVDTNNSHNRELAQIQVQVVAHGTRTPAVGRLQDIKVFRVNELGVNDIEYVGVKDDIFVFDHANDVIYRNNEEITKEKAFIGEYFELMPGENTLVAEPIESIESANVTWRDKYL